MMHGEMPAKAAMKGEKKHKPHVYVPIEADWHERLEVGEDTTIVLKGNVHSFTVSDSDEMGMGTNEVCIEVDDVRILEEGESNEYADMVKDD